MSNILCKLGLKSCTQAALYAIETGLASLSISESARRVNPLSIPSITSA